MAEANTVATPYTTDAGAVKDRIDTLSKQVADGYKSLPTMQDTIAQRVQAEEGFIQPTAEARGKLIQQLMEHDKVVASTYADKNSATFVEDPMARSRIQNSSEAPLWGSVSALGADIATRRALLGDVISRAVEAKKAELLAQQAEVDNLWKTLGLYQAERERNDKQEALTYQDAGDKIVGLNAKGEIKVTIPKASLADANTKAILDAIRKDPTSKPATTSAPETALSPEEAAKQLAKQAYQNMTAPQKLSFLEGKMNKGIPLSADELSDYTRIKGGNKPVDLSGALKTLDVKLPSPEKKGNLTLGTEGGMKGFSIEGLRF